MSDVKRQLKKLLAGFLGVQMIMTSGWTGQPVQARETGGNIAISQLPGTTVTEKDYDESFLSVTGYVEDGVSDRSIYYREYLSYNEAWKEKWIADGNKAEDYVMQNTANYYVVHNEADFCDAVSNYAKVIEIRSDLNLGYKYLEANDIESWGVVQPNISSNGEPPISSPDLIRDGVSKVNFSHRDGMTIFSPNGSTIYHCEFNFNDCNDIIIRNIGMQGMNEWDDTEQGKSAAGDVGGHKRYDWDFIAVNESSNIWIDHCTLGIAYDGSVDVCGGSTVAITWCEIGVPDENTLAEMHRTIDYLEELYQKGKSHQFYTAFRDGGATPEQIFRFSLINDKVHAVGENTYNYDKNIYDKITIAYTYYENSVQRVPSIRCGNAHVFNIWVNSEGYRTIYRELSDPANGKQKDANGNIISPVKYANSKHCSTLGLCRANCALGGATIGTDTCVFEGVINPIIGNEIVQASSANEDIQIGAVNHNLIVNSSFGDYGKGTYVGSSWDNNGNNVFVASDYWNGNKASINNFKWSKWVNLTKDSEKASDTVIYLPEADARKMSYGEFYRKYYIGQDELEYEYNIVPLNQVKSTLEKYSGCGKMSLTTEQWMTPDYETGEKYKVTFDYGVDGVMNPTYMVINGETVTFPEEVSKAGYTFDGWYTREYYAGEPDEWGDIPILYREVPFTEETAVTGDTDVYAGWKINQYQIKLELNGGTAAGPTAFPCNYGSMFKASTINNSLYTKEGYTLSGWYLDEALTKKASFMLVKEDITLFAKWEKRTAPTPTPEVTPSPIPTPDPTPEVTPSPTPTPGTEVMTGDVDGNGKVELADAQLVLKAALKIMSLDEQQTARADYDEDGNVTLADAQGVLRKALKIE